MRVPRRANSLLGVLVASLFVASCGGSGNSEANDPSTTPTAGVSTDEVSQDGSTEAAAQGPIEEGEAAGDPDPAAVLVLAVPSGEATIEIDADATGGLHPLLSWSSLPETDHYGVYLYAPSGEPYWFWRGSATQVYVGGEVQLNDDALGVAVADGMSWGVVGYSVDGSVVGVSELLPISP